jgi:LmbE family N-acetylglucosaminyl deacetylase
VWAHPDDEAFLSAGVMTVAASQGQRVVCVTATRGENGFPDDDARSPDERAALRVAELEACLAVLGIDDHRWLDYPDGGCHEVDERAPVQILAEIIDDVAPDTVLTFPPDGMTGHLDHITVSRWTTRAVAAAGSEARLLYATKSRDWAERFLAVMADDELNVMMDDEAQFPMTAPEELAFALDIDDDLLDVKVQALMAQASQIEPTVRQMGKEAFADFARDEFFRAPTASDWPV